MSTHLSLANHFLVAMPGLNDVVFSQAVIYICEHHERGTVGMIINRPTGHPASIVFEQLGIGMLDHETQQLPLLFGGPIQSERGFVIHRPTGNWQSSLSLMADEVTITTSNDIVRAIARHEGPKDALVVMGYVGWEFREIEREITKEDVWMVCPYKAELMFEVPFADRWKAAAMTLGVDMDNLTGSGHA
ncbi:MAG: YqgE/AlgH family protein [Gammaproteobacteria bacterium]|nr:YqgE/AlgH family protein [Gammaproteobacteria bacterium]